MAAAAELAIEIDRRSCPAWPWPTGRPPRSGTRPPRRRTRGMEAHRAVGGGAQGDDLGRAVEDAHLRPGHWALSGRPHGDHDAAGRIEAPERDTPRADPLQVGEEALEVGVVVDAAGAERAPVGRDGRVVGRRLGGQGALRGCGARSARDRRRLRRVRRDCRRSRAPCSPSPRPPGRRVRHRSRRCRHRTQRAAPQPTGQALPRAESGARVVGVVERS